MSSLPPYNPTVGDRAVWLLPVGTVADLPAVCPGQWTAAVVDDVALGQAVAVLCGLPESTLVQTPEEVEAPEVGWVLVAASPDFAERVLRHLMAMPDGTARFALQPGAHTVIQVLPDRAVLLRMNDGTALSTSR